MITNVFVVDNNGQRFFNFDNDGFNKFREEYCASWISGDIIIVYDYEFCDDNNDFAVFIKMRHDTDEEYISQIGTEDVVPFSDSDIAFLCCFGKKIWKSHSSVEKSKHIE